MNFNSTKSIITEIKSIMFEKNDINVLSFYTKNYGDFYNKILINKILKKNVHIVDINLYNRLNTKNFSLLLL